jgi:glycosyltransferase involved in cell wall biosynthesis
LIPPVFHYVWLSGDQLPAAFADNLSRARSLHPEFTFRAWTAADASEIDSQFLREAVAERKWAFATDVVRLYALSTYGGVYFDLDVRFNGPIDDWRRQECVIGWESDYLLGPHFMMSVKGAKFINDLLTIYMDRRFILDNETINVTPLPTIATWVAQRDGLILNGQKQRLTNGLLVETVNRFTLDTLDRSNICEHEYAGGWLEKKGSFASELMIRYARSSRPSRRLLDAATRFFPRAVSRRLYDLIHARLAYPGAFESVGYDTSKHLPRKLSRFLKGMHLLQKRGPLNVTSKWHLAARSSRKQIAPARVSCNWAPSVDVIVPIYNVERYLDRCLRSVQQQDYARVRVLLVDDGSTDGSSNIAKCYAQQVPHFEYHRKTNGGLGSARNYGLDLVTSELVTFVDSDDWVEPDFVSSLVEAIGPNQDIAVTNYDLVSPEGRVQQRFDLAFRWEEDPVKQILSSGLESSAWNKIYRSSLFDSDTRFGDGWFEDFAVIPALVAGATSVGFVSSHKYHYVQRPDSILAKSRTNLASTMNIFNSYSVLRTRKNRFIGDRWEHYYQWAIPRHLFISRAYNIHLEPIESRLQSMVRRFSAELNMAMPDWYETKVIQHWKNEPSRFVERIARRVLVDAYKSERPQFYSALQALHRYGF